MHMNMSASTAASSSWRICRRYKIFVYFSFIALSIQLFLGYSFYSLHSQEFSKLDNWKKDIEKKLILFHAKPKDKVGDATVYAKYGALSLKCLRKADVFISYTYAEIVADIQQSIYKVVEHNLVDSINEATFYVVEADEATDSSNKSILVAYTRFVGNDNRPVSNFLGLQELEAGTANNVTHALKDLLQLFKAMNPFLITNHCLAHILQLAAEKAAIQDPAIMNYIGTLNTFAKDLKFSLRLTCFVEASKDEYNEKAPKIKRHSLQGILIFGQDVSLRFPVAVRPPDLALIDDINKNIDNHENTSHVITAINKKLPEKNIYLPKYAQNTIQNWNENMESLFNCTNIFKAITAISRAKTDACKLELRKTACLGQQQKLYPMKLQRSCPMKGDHPIGTYMGCYKDDKLDRDLSNFHVGFPLDNTPEKCINYCLSGGYEYAGVQYKSECWCGHSYGKHGSLLESSCNARCPGNASETCGGYTAQRIFSTGLPRKKVISPDLVYKHESVEKLSMVRIVFVLTLNGRDVRQVRRLLIRLYAPEHYYFIHVDSRSDYMYRELLPLEDLLPNVKLAHDRFASIWGGASLLQAHLSFMKALLDISHWHWDYYVNLSESDYPIKDLSLLVMFLTKYKGHNFMKSNGRETPEFLKKQGVDQLFYECENHMWLLGKRALPEGVLFDGGSDWLGLYRDLCEYAVTSDDPLLLGLHKFYKYTLLPVESFFHTMVLNSIFCESWIDNNLHVTNWKRKLGCKCQHKNVVDWCGCSPVVFKIADLDKLSNYKTKPVFFGRKFEPVVNQEIINSIDIELGLNISGLRGWQHHWHSNYHHMDSYSKMTDITLTFAHSFVRRTLQVFKLVQSSCAWYSYKILESHVLNVADSFHRYIVKFNATLPDQSSAITIETQFNFKPHSMIVNPTGPIIRLQSLEVGTDFDPKELIFRNYAMFIGPESQVELRVVWGFGPEITVSVVWIDPTGVVAVYSDISVATESLIESYKPQLNLPLRPGKWTVKVVYQLEVCAEVQFLVSPYTELNGQKVTPENVSQLHNGPLGSYSVVNTSNLLEILEVTNSQMLIKQSVINGQKVGSELESWVDNVTSEMWIAQDACSTRTLGKSCPPIDVCSDTNWSSLSPDPKSDITQLFIK